jgi:chromosome segregation ATPase
MTNYVLDLEVDRVDLVDEGCNSEAYIKIIKQKGANKMTLTEILAGLKPEHASVVKSALAAKDTEVTTLKEEVAKSKEALETAKTELATTQEEITKSKQAEVTTEDVIKGLDPKVQEIFKSLQSQKDAAEEIAKQLNEEKVEKAAKAKAEELKNIPVDEAKLVAVAKSASPEVFEVLKAASNAINSEVLVEKGSNKEGSAGSENAWAQIEKKAADLAVATNVTKAKAIATVIKDEPALYNQYLKGGN